MKNVFKEYDKVKLIRAVTRDDMNDNGGYAGEINEDVGRVGTIVGLRSGLRNPCVWVKFAKESWILPEFVLERADSDVSTSYTRSTTSTLQAASAVVKPLLAVTLLN